MMEDAKNKKLFQFAKIYSDIRSDIEKINIYNSKLHIRLSKIYFVSKCIIYTIDRELIRISDDILINK